MPTDDITPERLHEIANTIDRLHPGAKLWHADAEAIRAAADRLDALKRENAELRAEIIEAYTEIILYGGSCTDPKSPDGWHCTNAKSGICYAGKRLVELGAWEAHPDNVPTNRVAWFRPKETA
jgi:hypothetical protein